MTRLVIIPPDIAKHFYGELPAGLLLAEDALVEEVARLINSDPEITTVRAVSTSLVEVGRYIAKLGIALESKK